MRNLFFDRQKDDGRSKGPSFRLAVCGSVLLSAPFLLVRSWTPLSPGWTVVCPRQPCAATSASSAPRNAGKGVLAGRTGNASTLTSKNKLLTILPDAEHYALYDLADFDDGQQLEYLSLSESELALACGRPGLHAQVYCVLQIGYSRAKNAFFRFAGRHRLDATPRRKPDDLLTGQKEQEEALRSPGLH